MTSAGVEKICWRDEELSTTVAAKVAVTVGQGDPLIRMQGSAVPEVPLVRLKTVDALLPTGREPRLA